METLVLALAAVLAIGLILLVVQTLRLSGLQRHVAETTGPTKPLKLAEPTAAELEAKLKAAYEAKIAEATQTFGTDLTATSARLSEQVSRLTTSVIEEELDAYHKTLEGVRQAATEAMEQIHTAVEQQRGSLQKSMEADLAGERERLAAQFDTKLGDVISSYIAESLGGGVDLGAQMQYIVATLEAHKADIKKDLTGGV